MTCIVAVEDETGVVMGGDRGGSNGHSIDSVVAPKIFTNGPLLIGYTSSFRMGQLLEHALAVPKLRRSVDTDAWVTLDLMVAVRAAFKEHEWHEVTSGVAEGGSWLLAVRGRAYAVQSDYSAIRSVTGEYATGSGTTFAAGSLHTTRNLPSNIGDAQMRPIVWGSRMRVHYALEAAAYCCTSVQGPFDILTQEKPR